MIEDFLLAVEVINDEFYQVSHGEGSKVPKSELTKIRLQTLKMKQQEFMRL
jgi:hypothetical protein